MPKYIEATNRLDAWTQATRYLLSCPDRMDISVVLSIKNPLSNGPNSLQADRLMDAFLDEQKGGQPIHTVAETIFPGWQYVHHGLKGVYETYPEEEYPLIKDRWGRYAYRLLRRRGPDGAPLRDKDGNIVNPLERVIGKMKRQTELRTTLRSAYEVNFGEPEDLLEESFDLPTFDTSKDINMTLGQPCLSHVTLKLFAGCVHLTALYRSHCYTLKAYGNMLGLARLQACVAEEVGVPVGGMTIHSSYAFAKKGIRKLERLLDALDALGEKEGGHLELV